MLTEATEMLHKFVFKIFSSVWGQKYELGILEYRETHLLFV